MSTTELEAGMEVLVDGVPTHYHVAGDGPGLLLLHGSGPGVSAWANWRGVIPALAERFRVIAPDLLGFGRSQPPSPVHYDAAAWMRHLLGFMDALGLDRMSVVGNSFGGSLALRLALARPAAVERLVLMGSVGLSFPITAGLEAVWGFTPTFANMRALLDLFAHDRSRVTDDLARLRLAAATAPGVQESFSRMFPAPRQAALDAMSLPEADIGTIDQPTLIVHGREDRIIPMSVSLRLLELVEDAQMHVFGHCGHWVQIEERDAFVSLVRGFLAGPAAEE